MAASLRELLRATSPHTPRCARHPLPRGERGKPARSGSRDRFPTRHREDRAAARGDLAPAAAFQHRHREGRAAASGVDLEPLSPRGRGAGVRGLVAHGRIAARAAPCDIPSHAALRAAPSPTRGEGKAGAIRFSRPPSNIVIASGPQGRVAISDSRPPLDLVIASGPQGRVAISRVRPLRRGVCPRVSDVTDPSRP
jgi:hypothetical protein